MIWWKPISVSLEYIVSANLMTEIWLNVVSFDAYLVRINGDAREKDLLVALDRCLRGHLTLSCPMSTWDLFNPAVSTTSSVTLQGVQGVPIYCQTVSQRKWFFLYQIFIVLRVINRTINKRPRNNHVCGAERVGRIARVADLDFLHSSLLHRKCTQSTTDYAHTFYLNRWIFRILETRNLLVQMVYWKFAIYLRVVEFSKIK